MAVVRCARVSDGTASVTPFPSQSLHGGMGPSPAPGTGRATRWRDPCIGYSHAAGSPLGRQRRRRTTGPCGTSGRCCFGWRWQTRPNTPWRQDEACGDHNRSGLQRSCASECLWCAPKSHVQGVLSHCPIHYDPRIHGLEVASVNRDVRVACLVPTGAVAMIVHYGRMLYDAGAKSRLGALKSIHASLLPTGQQKQRFSWAARLTNPRPGETQAGLCTLRRRNPEFPASEGRRPRTLCMSGQDGNSTQDDTQFCSECWTRSMAPAKAGCRVECPAVAPLLRVVFNNGPGTSAMSGPASGRQRAVCTGFRCTG